MPALEARNASLQRMRELLGIGGDAGASGYGSFGRNITAADVQSEPGYQFGLDQSMRALNNQLAARGMRNSGAALKSAARYASDYATTKYDNAFNRINNQQTNQFNRFASVSGLGQTGANALSSAGQNYANQVGANTTGLGNALAASSLAQGNAWSGTANQLSGWYANQARNGGVGSSGWDMGGYNGSNDRGMFSTGSNTDWWARNGTGGD